MHPQPRPRPQTLPADAGSEAIQQALAELGCVHISGVIDPQVLDAVEAELSDALRTRADAWHAAGRTQGGLADGSRGLRELLTEAGAIPGFTSDLLAELDITLPHAPFAVVTADDVFHLGNAVLDLITHERLLDVLATLLGDDIVASANQHCRIKLPTRRSDPDGQHRSAEAPTLWHQDLVTQMPEADDSNVITCWVAGHDTKEEDGCLVVVTGRHHEGLYPWPFSPSFIADLEAQCVPVPARRGDIILMDKRTPHASLPNTSGQARWSFDLRFHPADQLTDRPWYPAIPVRNTSGPVVRDLADWQTQWEAARDALIEDGRPLPGRPEWSQPFADALISSWAAGGFPRAASPT